MKFDDIKHRLKHVIGSVDFYYPLEDEKLFINDNQVDRFRVYKIKNFNSTLEIEYSNNKFRSGYYQTHDIDKELNNVIFYKRVENI